MSHSLDILISGRVMALRGACAAINDMHHYPEYFGDLCWGGLLVQGVCVLIASSHSIRSDCFHDQLCWHLQCSGSAAEEAIFMRFVGSTGDITQSGVLSPACVVSFPMFEE